MLRWYAETYGISDLDIAEAPWVADWVKRHGNSLRYDHLTFRWKWIED
jgi:hypothetical protein